MTVKQTHAAPTLLPCLTDLGSGMRLKLKMTGTESGPDNHSPTIVEGAGPFATILEGILTSDGQGAWEHLFLLIQPDRYDPAPSELRPVTNAQVDSLWQSAWEHLKETTGGEWPLAFAGQIDPEGRLVQFRPLFYCRHKDRYAHPLCPDCGSLLTLCRDDALLAGGGLPAYAKTLDRYLHCPSCNTAGKEAIFYARSLETATAESSIRNCAQLIEGFSALLAKEELAADLPCVGCDQATECYGPRTLVRQRMHPVSFYPFFMMAQPAPSMNAVEFLHLLSGATFDEMAHQLIRKQKPGRLRHLEAMKSRLAIGDGLLFKGDRRLLEVLYLKLAFLEELSTLVLHENGPFCSPVTEMSLDCLWVRLPQGTTRLPLFWNFSLHLVDPVGNPPQAVSNSILSSARARQFLGTAWCYALLVDLQQDMAAVQAAVDRLLLNPDQMAQIETGTDQELDPVFSFHHLLWRSRSMTIAPQWEEIWRRALLLGLEVLQAGLRADPEWQKERFEKQLSVVREKIHDLIFQPQASAAAVISEPDHTAIDAAPASADAGIAGILKNILDGWPTAATPPAGPAATSEETQIIAQTAGHPNEDGDFEETVILESPAPRPQLPADVGGAAAPDFEKTVIMETPQSQSGTPPPAWPGEDSQATLIINTGQHPEPPTPQKRSAPYQEPSSAGPPEAPELEETVLMGTAGPAAGASGPPEDNMPATMIISPEQAPVSQQQGLTATPKTDSGQTSLVDALEQTVIQSGGSPGVATPPPRQEPPTVRAVPPDAPDELEKTVILQSEKGKKGGGKK